MPRKKILTQSQLINKIIIGDNLPVLRSIDSESIDLVCIDPPFNKDKKYYGKGNNWFNDDFRLWENVFENKAEKDACTELIKEKFPVLNNLLVSYRMMGHDKDYYYSVWLAVRLLEIHRVLKPTGTLMLHCDHSMNNKIETMLEVIFGNDNKINEIIWFYPDTPGRSKRFFPKKHDVIFWFRKGSEWTFNGDDVKIPMLEETANRYKYDRVLGGKVYEGASITTIDGKIPEDVWRIPAVKGNSKEAVGQATQKPIKLYETLIKASTNVGDIILDCFAGCGTTMVAANRWGRKFIGIELQNEEEIRIRIGRNDLSGYDSTGTLINENVITTDNIYHAKNITIKRNDDNEITGRKFNRKQMKTWLYFKQKGKCVGKCHNREIPEDLLELDHIHPKSKGGIDSIENMQLLCGSCNKSKGNKSMEEWMAEDHLV